MTENYVINTKMAKIMFGDYEEDFDCSVMASKSIACMVHEDGERWVEYTPFNGRDYDFSHAGIDREIAKACDRRLEFLKAKREEEEGNKDDEPSEPEPEF